VVAENIEAPGGRIVRGATETGVRTMGRVENIKQFNDIIIKNVGGAPIRFRDIGYAEDNVAERRTFAYYQDKAAVTLDVRRQVGVNTVKVVEAAQKKLAAIKPALPPAFKSTCLRSRPPTFETRSVRSKST